MRCCAARKMFDYCREKRMSARRARRAREMRARATPFRSATPLEIFAAMSIADVAAASPPRRYAYEREVYAAVFPSAFAF